MSLDVVFLVLAVVLGLSRAFSFTSKLWAKVPAKLTVFVPALVACVPFVLSVVGVGSSVGVLHTLAVVVALLVPGLKDHALGIGHNKVG